MEKLLERAVRGFRERRMRRFARRFGITPQTTILDVGGTALNWSLLPVRPRIVFLNIGQVRPEPGFPRAAGP